MSTYQRHDNADGSVSNTQRKLSRLRLPENFSGFRVLDIGCNEGFFCGLAHARGATEVIGIDFVKSNIEFAKQRYGGEGVKFSCRPWSDLPDGPFDLVMWVSAMHYEADPRAIIDAITQRLSPNGLLILECGVLMTYGREYVPVPRLADTRYYPSRDFLINGILSAYSVRQVAEPELTEGDFVPRAVFHCRRAVPSVLLLRGPSGTGKTTLAESLKHSASKIISLDVVVSRMGQNPFPHNTFERFMVDNYDPTDLTRIYSSIDDSGLTDEYARWLCQMIAGTDAVVIFEGHISDAQCVAMQRALAASANVWDAQRVTPVA